MTKVAFEFPDEDDGESAGERKTPDDMFPELTAKHKEQREILARLVELVSQFEAQTRRSIEEEERGR